MNKNNNDRGFWVFKNEITMINKNELSTMKKNKNDQASDLKMIR